jgi:putative membrane protein
VINRIKMTHLILLIIVITAFTWSAIKAVDYFTWVLEVTPAILGILILLFSYHRFRFTTLSYVIITVLTIFMFIGGHYTYARVPLFNWIKDNFHLQRNEYDRFGHFAKGFFAIVVREILIRKSCLHPSKWLIFITLSIVLALSAIYEIIEWLVGEIVGRSAKDFLGTQGDVWDSEWDMSLAFLGGILCLLILSRLHNKLLKNV